MYGKHGSFGYCWNNAVKTAGYRERYAIKHGKRELKYDGDHKLWVFIYSTDDPYQDANGASYDVTTGNWIN